MIFSAAISTNCPPSRTGIGNKFINPKLILNKAIIPIKDTRPALAAEPDKTAICIGPPTFSAETEPEINFPIESIKRKQVEQEFSNGKGDSKKKKFDFHGEMKKFSQEQKTIQNIPQVKVLDQLQTLLAQPESVQMDIIEEAIAEKKDDGKKDDKKDDKKDEV